MLHVVIDANTVGLRAPMAGNAQRLLLDAAEKGQIKLVVPELVVREVVNKWRENVAKELDRLQAPVRDLAKHGVDVGVPAAFALDDLTADVEQRLREALATPGVLRPRYPEVEHADIVQRALDRRLPFDKGGKDGYRDTLLWETVVQLAHDNEVVLVSKDARAFAGDDGGTLARALVAEVAARVGGDAIVSLENDPQNVVDRIAAEDDAVRAVVDEIVRQRSFRVLLEEQLDDEVFGVELDAQDRRALRLDVSVPLAMLVSAGELGIVKVGKTYSLPSGSALVRLDVQTGVTIAMTVTGADALELEADEDVWPGGGLGWDDIRLSDDAVLLLTTRLVHLEAETSLALPVGRLERLVVNGVRLADPTESLTVPVVVDDADSPFGDDEE